MHLIYGNSEDYHAAAVAWAMRKLGAEAFIWDGLGATKDAQMTLTPGALPGRTQMGMRTLPKLDSVWFRRIVKHAPVKNVDKEAVKFVEQELKFGHLNLAVTVRASAKFMVGNPFPDPTQCKAFQLDTAAALGFLVPETLISTHYDEVASFVRRVGKVAVKPFNPYFWHYGDERTYRIASTTVLDGTAELESDQIEVCPAIYQRYIEKQYELRVTVIGSHIFAAKISRADGGSFVDWRFGIGGREAVVEAVRLGSSTEMRIRQLLATFDLKYGCLDLVVDPCGDIYFLEINPGGQFLFIESMVREFPMLAAFASMLRAQTTDFSLTGQDQIGLPQFEKTQEFEEMVSRRGTVVTSSAIYREVEATH
ncbi:ATP-grasp domain-containing protein [Xanthomonas fragariae]|uniref:ATP-grasp domain-containing protein n=1 Tax=Xanthomonas fragariae TaxID=48664 RepID=UPI000D55AF71|nr:hypothetical protein [Xanthomonas fragariae]MDM7556186.1 hypothetical protein [Xanthomonas fragariae]MDM7559275.1 hypothetical protein [Xanthomonas fragariae]MDM7576956.1 hypothetical protein [Xanthomonas fragariae]MDM7580052.1 hypothetical protein [Xanthomonas fragariae]MDM7590246.1 hypothetical protein [Xanthomonas fragariae]